MESKTISIKAPADLIDEVDGLVQLESEEIGLPVDRSGFVLRALRNDVKARNLAQLRRDRKVIYISGPITGMPGLNKQAFIDAELHLIGAGFEVVNPVDNGVPDAAEWSQHMRADIRQMMDCQCMALLPGWDASKGVALEMKIAEQLGFDVRPLAEWLHAGKAAA